MSDLEAAHLARRQTLAREVQLELDRRHCDPLPRRGRVVRRLIAWVRDAMRNSPSRIGLGVITMRAGEPTRYQIGTVLISDARLDEIRRDAWRPRQMSASVSAHRLISGAIGRTTEA